MAAELLGSLEEAPVGAQKRVVGWVFEPVYVPELPRTARTRDGNDPFRTRVPGLAAGWLLARRFQRAFVEESIGNSTWCMVVLERPGRLLLLHQLGPSGPDCRV
jgi:hypothetical protein